MRDEVDRLSMKSQELIRENQKLHTRLAEREALTIEWMHSNEIFKRLALRFGKKLNVPKSEILMQIDEVALDLAEEDPRFKNTNITKEALFTKKSLK